MLIKQIKENIESSDIVKTPKELGHVLKNEEETIVIEGDLASEVIRIKAIGKVAWGVAIGAIDIAVCCTLATSAVTVATDSATDDGGYVAKVARIIDKDPADATIMGISAPVAIAIAVAGGIGALTSLRDKYQIEIISSNNVILNRK